MFFWLLAAASGIYLLLMGPLIAPFDPVPIVDEALAIGIFAYAMRALGYDVARWIPFVRRFRQTTGGGRAVPPSGGPAASRKAEKDTVIDV